MIKLGTNSKIDKDVVLGYPLTEDSDVTIGNDCIIRSGTIIYNDVVIGNKFISGHNVLIRERTRIGNLTLVGTSTIIDGNCDIGDGVKIQSGVYIPPHTQLCDNIFVGPRVTFTNDKYPPSDHSKLSGAFVLDNAIIGANSTILPGVVIHEGSFIAAGTVVSKDVPSYKMAIGSPMRITDLPEKMKKHDTDSKTKYKNL